MDISAAIQGRRSVRGFLKKPVPKETIFKILDMARWAPSGVNTQPWQVAVIGSKMQRIISEKILAARQHNVVQNPDYDYYPSHWVEPYSSRRKACGLALYGALHIDKTDMPRRLEQWYKNYKFFGAPCALIIYLDKKLCQGSWIDLGMFIQNILLATRHFGLESCPQAALAEYPDIVREALKISNAYVIVCGISLGFADWSLPENNYRTEREPVDTFTQWFD